jgi:hypothetical protein
MSEGLIDDLPEILAEPNGIPIGVFRTVATAERRHPGPQRKGFPSAVLRLDGKR